MATNSTATMTIISIMKIHVHKSKNKVKLLQTIPEESVHDQAFSRHSSEPMQLEPANLPCPKSKYFTATQSNSVGHACIDMHPSSDTSICPQMPGQSKNDQKFVRSFGASMSSRAIETNSTSLNNQTMQSSRHSNRQTNFQVGSSLALRSFFGNYSYSSTPGRTISVASGVFQSKQFVHSTFQVAKQNNKRKYDSFANHPPQPSFSMKSVFDKYPPALPSKKAKLESPFDSHASILNSLPMNKLNYQLESNLLTMKPSANNRLIRRLEQPKKEP